MEETDDFIDEPDSPETVRREERQHLLRAFGDDVAQRFLLLRGIKDDRMQNAVLDRYAQRQATLAAIAQL